MRGLRVEGFRERTLITRFGEVVVRRRMYNDGKTGVKPACQSTDEEAPSTGHR